MAGESDKATFRLDLESNLPRTAADAADALASLQQRIQGEENALKKLQAAMHRMQGGTSVNIKKFKDLREAIAAQQSRLQQSSAAFQRLNTHAGKLRPTLSGIKTTMADLGAQVAAMPGPMGALAARLGVLASIVGGGVIAAGVVAIAAALVALAAGAAAAVGALAKYGIAQADARRSDLLRLEGLSKYRNFWREMLGMGRKADTGQFLATVVDDVTSSVALARDQVSGLTGELYRAGLRGANLKAATEGAAIALATQGEAGANQFKAMAMSAHLFGSSVQKLSNDIKARLGGIAKAQLLSLDVQFRKMKENITLLFAGLKIEKLLEAVKVVTDLFSQTTFIGRALKTLIETLLQPLIDWVGSHGLVFKRFFQGMIIVALGFAIAVLDMRDKLREAFGDSRILQGIDLTKLALHAGGIAASVFAGGLIAVATAGAVVAAAMALAMLPIIALGAAFYGLYHAGKFAWDFLSGIEWSTLGSRVIDGIVSGIQSGIQKVKDTITSLATVMRNAMANSLQIRSPSRVFADLAKHIPAGVEVGIRAGTPGVREATEEMVEPAMPRPAVAASSLGSGGGSNTFNFGDINVNGAATDTPKDFAAEIRREVVNVFEGIKINLAGARVT